MEDLVITLVEKINNWTERAIKAETELEKLTAQHEELRDQFAKLKVENMRQKEELDRNSATISFQYDKRREQEDRIKELEAEIAKLTEVQNDISD